jgi:DMSO/TMAO reductase YedYZ molybdopterin-dependent catalytic subunit
LKILIDLPVYHLPRLKTKSNKWTLAVQGEVSRPLRITLEEIDNLPTIKLSQDFNCLEGWSVKNVLWEGVRASRVIDSAQLNANAKCILFGSGNYTTMLNLKTALDKTTILARKKFGKELTSSSGGPLRLVFRGQNCYESVRSVDTITALPEISEGTARNIATQRLSAEAISE